MIIAEAAANHNGDLKIAKKLVDLAVDCGCDVIKFQKRNPEKCIPEDQRNKTKYDTPWGDIKYLDYRKLLEFDKTQYKEIDDYCRRKGILWTASVWDEDSFDFIKKCKVPFIKIPSAKITDKSFLHYVSKKWKKPVIMSLGMSTEKQIDEAIKIFKGHTLTILWCNSSYPAKDEELDLNVIPELKLRYPHCQVGYSGHEEGISACIVAKTLGAEVFERHITLSRSMWGTDQSASIVKDQLYRLVRDLKKVNIWRGSLDINVYKSELKVAEKLRGLK